MPRISPQSSAHGPFLFKQQLAARRARNTFRPLVEHLETRSLPSFLAGVNYGTTPGEGSPRSVITGDFNGDGRADLAVSMPLGYVNVLLGNGNGTFRPAMSTLDLGVSFFGLAAGDVNKDGKLDLVVGNNGQTFVSVLLGNGNGRFKAPVNLNTGTSPRNVAVADVNGDGKLDIIAANYGRSTVSVLLGNGDGTFKAAANFSTDYTPSTLAVVDANGDGKPDIITANRNGGGSGDISVLLGNGNGTFGSATNFSTAGSAYGMAVADLNGDGKVDVVTANYHSGTVGILLGNGNGTFGSAATINGGRPNEVAIGDFDGDGKPDLAITEYNTDNVSVYLGNGNGTFGSPANDGVGGRPFGILTFDLNGDGKPDLVTANDQSQDVTVSLNNGNGTFPAPSVSPTGSNPYSVAIGDFNGDGKPDLVTADRGIFAATVLLGNGDGTFQAPLNVSLPNAAYSVVVGDFNGDGKQDLAISGGGNIVTVILGNGNGTFQPGDTLYFVGSAPRSLVAADLNGDGQLDLVTADVNANEVSALIGNGNGTFQAAVNYSTLYGANRAAVGDINGDGGPDLVVVGGNTLAVLFGNGNGTFLNATNFNIGETAYAVTLADLNGDGKLDAIVPNGRFDTLAVLLGNGNGTFQAPVNFSTGVFPTAIAVADINDDGNLDLVTTNNSTADVSVLLGHGNGTFVPAVNFAVGALNPYNLAIADLNGNSTPDIITSDYGSSQISVIQNTLTATHFAVSAPSGSSAGSAFSVTVTAQDASNNLVTSYLGAVHFSSTDMQNGLPTDYHFVASDHGVHTFVNQVTFKTAGSQTVIVTDRLFTAITGSVAVSVTALSASSLTVTGLESPTIAELPATITVSAVDPFGNVAPTYQGTVHFKSSDGQAILPMDYTFVAGDKGVHKFINGVTLQSVGSETVTATDTVTAAISGSEAVQVIPAADHFNVSGPATATAGFAFTVTVTALDASGNTATKYLGTIHFTSNDPRAVLPSDYTFVAADQGVHTFANAVILKRAGGNSVAATDTMTASITGQTTLVVNPGAIDGFALSGLPYLEVAGAAASYTVSAIDAFGNLVSTYLGTINFASNDPKALLFGHYTFTAADAGVHFFANAVTFETAAIDGLAALDITNGAIHGVKLVNVAPAAASTLLVTAPGTATAGTPFTITVTALDPFGNVARSYRGLVHFASTDGSASLPADYRFTTADQGVHTFVNLLTLRTSGSQTITATDKNHATITGTAIVSVGPGVHRPERSGLASVSGFRFDRQRASLDLFFAEQTAEEGGLYVGSAGR
jgi:hypothetical protein